MLRRIFDNLIDIKKSFFSTFYIISLIILTSYFIYVTGGTAFAYTHMMYIPVILSAFIYNVKGSIITAFLAGIALGPHMPLNVAEGIMQEPGSWIIRTCFFILMGLIISLLLERIKKDRDIQIENSYLNVTTGFPNINKLKIDLNELVHNNNEFSLITFKIMNLDQINRYVDYSIGDKSIFVVIDALAEFFNINSIYSIFNDELCIVMPGSSVEYAYAKSSEFLNCFKEPVHVDGLPVDINIISSISNFPIHGNNARDVFKNAGKALDKEIIDEKGISIYNKSISKKCKQKYETIVSLYNAIKSDKFTLVYQPKINLKRNEVMGVEALLRWNDGNIGNMNVAEFIKIA